MVLQYSINVSIPEGDHDIFMTYYFSPSLKGDIFRGLKNLLVREAICGSVPNIF
jgi:hypothetical protein